ncbi:MAG: agmatine deiminase family protein [Planctomycetota bacterium]
MWRRIGTVMSIALLLATGATAVADPGEPDGPLPRWREGGTPPVDPNQALYPYAVTRDMSLEVPTTGVTDCVFQLTRSSLYDEIAWVVVSSAAQQNAATNQFTAAGADMSKVEFLIMPSNSIWLRDYGPHFIWQDGALAIVDSHYYPTRPLDNFVPTRIADDHFQIPSYDVGLYYSGGNFQPGADRWGYTTSLVHQDNPGFGEAFISELFQTYQGIDTLHIFPRLPSSVDGTGHIDMWFYMVDEDTVIISEFLPGSNATAIQITNDATAYMEGLGFEVVRVPDHNGYNPGDPNCHYTYTNAYRVNDRIFIPTYGQSNPSHLDRDAQAIDAWEQAAPEARIVPINCYNIIWAAGAIHCIVMQVPRYEDPIPAAHVISPDGGEVLVSGTTHDLSWLATDDVDVTSIDLSYSTDGGSTFPYPIATSESNDGHYDWTVPGTVSGQAVVRAEAHDGDGNSFVADGAGTFTITGAPRTVYDFSTGAGVDKWAWGYQTSSWSVIGGNRYPVPSELSAANYTRISTSNASGGDSDGNRYGSPTPSGGYETTHVFEFTILEDPSLILDIGILWEGYGDDCTQMEMYVWDDDSGDWADGSGQFGQNRYMDNFAGNRDETLEGHIYADFWKYLDTHGMLTVLLYGERYGDRSFHDYVSVTVTHQNPADLDGDGIVGVNDFLLLLAAWGPCPDPCPPACLGDLDGNCVVNVNDFLLLLAAWT